MGVADDNLDEPAGQTAGSSTSGESTPDDGSSTGGESTPDDGSSTSGESTPDDGSDSTPANPDVVSVQFEITVPNYMSNALQVRIAWWDIDEHAQWVGDEYWSASVEFPVNRGGDISIIFYDDNGGIVLGSYESYISTNDYANSSYIIQADQFNTDRWDNDLDGDSNLEELRAGTDPYDAAQPNSLPVLYTIPAPTNYARTYARTILSDYSSGYEDRISEERPYFFYEEVLPNPPQDQPSNYGTTRNVTINIDSLGNGLHEYENIYRDLDTTTVERFNGTRTNTGSSIQWMGKSYRLDSSAYRGYEYEFTNDTQIIDEQTRQQQGSVVGGSIGYAMGGNSLEYNLRGTPLPDSDYCEPNSGTLYFNDRYDNDPYATDEDSYAVVNYFFDVSRAIDDEFWTVNVFNNDNELIDGYYVQTLDFNFRCNFQDL